jgi:hypothetical protein
VQALCHDSFQFPAHPMFCQTLNGGRCSESLHPSGCLLEPGVQV